jgi:hypothetical protein
MRPALTLAALLLVGCSEPPMLVGRSPEPPPTQVTGLITETIYEGEQMTSFVVESREGTFEILLDPERDYGFNLKHLDLHRNQELPVQVPLESRDGALYAVDVLDA